MKKEVKNIDVTEELTGITKELVKAARIMDRKGILLEVQEALDETIEEYSTLEELHDQMDQKGVLIHIKEERLILGNQVTILRVLQYLLTEEN